MDLVWNKRLNELEYRGRLTDSTNIIARWLSSIFKPDIKLVGSNFRFTEPQLNRGNKKHIDKTIRDKIKLFLEVEFLVYISKLEKNIRKHNTSCVEDCYLSKIKLKIKNKRWISNIIRELHDYL